MEALRLKIIAQIFKNSLRKVVIHWKIATLQAIFWEKLHKYPRIFQMENPQSYFQRADAKVLKQRSNSKRTRVTNYHKRKKVQQISFIDEEKSQSPTRDSASEKRSLSFVRPNLKNEKITQIPQFETFPRGLEKNKPLTDDEDEVEEVAVVSCKYPFEKLSY